MISNLFFFVVGLVCKELSKWFLERLKSHFTNQHRVEIVLGASAQGRDRNLTLAVRNIGPTTIPAFGIMISGPLKVFPFFLEGKRPRPGEHWPKESPPLLPGQFTRFECHIVRDGLFRHPFGLTTQQEIFSSPRISLVMTHSEKVLESTAKLAVSFLRLIQEMERLTPERVFSTFLHVANPDDMVYRTPSPLEQLTTMIDENHFPIPSRVHCVLGSLLVILFVLMQLFPAR